MGRLSHTPFWFATEALRHASNHLACPARVLFAELCKDAALGVDHKIASGAQCTSAKTGLMHEIAMRTSVFAACGSRLSPGLEITCQLELTCRLVTPPRLLFASPRFRFTPLTFGVEEVKLPKPAFQCNLDVFTMMAMQIASHLEEFHYPRMSFLPFLKVQIGKAESPGDAVEFICNISSLLLICEHLMFLDDFSAELTDT